MRIALLSETELVNSNYRAYQPMQALSRKGHEIEVNRKNEPLPPHVLIESDVVHVHRIATPDLQWLVRQAKDAGVAIVWDNDDDVAAMPKTNPLYARYGGPKSRGMLAGVKAMVQLADVVTTPSEVLAEQYRGLGGADVRVLENYLPREFSRVRPVKHEGVAIACLAGLEHQIDYQRLGLRETLERLLDAHPDLRVLSIGLGLGLPPERYEHIKLVDFLELARTLARCDIGIAPIVDIPWNRARSNVKLKEYAAAGLPWLASPVGPYLSMGEEQGGRLVPDDGWFDALDQLVTSARERRKLAKRATRWVKGEGIERHAHRWETALNDAIEHARARSTAASPV
jgi:glycosyltransferase involved in cell wall biosynthesis